MKYMLDSDICIYYINKKPSRIIEKMAIYRHEGICISSISLSELKYGLAKSAHKDKNLKSLQQFLSIITVVPFDEFDTVHYGDIRLSLERQGRIIGPLDMLIAAHAKARGLILVTNNTKEFERVEGLKVENWT
jgi:tRNA(fMet)-specific endonuclease VapC